MWPGLQVRPTPYMDESHLILIRNHIQGSRKTELCLVATLAEGGERPLHRMEVHFQVDFAGRKGGNGLAATC